MTYKTIKFKVGNEEHSIIKCYGEGQCSCRFCKTRNWTNWFYKLHENNDGVLCQDCLEEYFIKKRIIKELKQFTFDIESYLAYHNDEDTLTKKEIFIMLSEILKEKYNIETKEI